MSFDLTIRAPISKVDEERRTVFGWALVCDGNDGRPLVDHQGDIVPEDEIEKAAHQFMAKRSGSGLGGVMHRQMQMADVVESMVLTKAKREALGMGPGQTGWLVTLKIHDDEVWEKVKAGQMLEFSISGSAERVPVEVQDG